METNNRYLQKLLNQTQTHYPLQSRTPLVIFPFQKNATSFCSCSTICLKISTNDCRGKAPRAAKMAWNPPHITEVSYLNHVTSKMFHKIKGVGLGLCLCLSMNLFLSVFSSVEAAFQQLCQDISEMLNEILFHFESLMQLVSPLTIHYNDCILRPRHRPISTPHRTAQGHWTLASITPKGSVSDRNISQKTSDSRRWQQGKML